MEGVVEGTMSNERSFSGNWHGRARKSAVLMQNSVRALIYLLDDLGIMADDFYWDADEDARCYVNRVIWSERNKITLSKGNKA